MSDPYKKKIKDLAVKAIELNRALHWHFYKAGPTGWFWTLCDWEGNEVKKGGPFPTFIGCLFDAQKNRFAGNFIERRKPGIASQMWFAPFDRRKPPPPKIS